MNRFAALLASLENTTQPSGKVAALTDYLRTAPPADSLWCIALLSGRRPKRIATSAELRQWCLQVTGLPDWLFAESHSVVDDLAETIAVLVPPPEKAELHDLSDTIAKILALTDQTAPQRQAAILSFWQTLAPPERLVFNKLITGGFRVTLGQSQTAEALCAVTGTTKTTLAHRLASDWHPGSTSFADLTSDTSTIAGPYPFAPAIPVDADVATLGPPGDWIAEWKWDGLRAQILCRADGFAIWSSTGDLITDRFPDFAILGDHLPPGTVLDGEVLAWRNDHPLPSADLQKRISRKSLSKRLLTEVPVQFIAFDLLEDAGKDLRAAPLSQRRAQLAKRLAALPPDLPIDLSPTLDFVTWDGLAAPRVVARDRMAKGLILKRLDAPYLSPHDGRAWRAWAPDPQKVIAVLIYAQADQGGRSAPLTEVTFAVRHGNDLVPVAKARPNLPETERADVTRWVYGHIAERFGPVRRVAPELVFEIAFDDVQESPRHKAGITLTHPRILRWQRDMTADQIDTLESLLASLPPRSI